MNAEATLSHHEFETFTRMLEDNVGLYLGKEKEYLISSRLMPIAKQHEFTGYIALVQKLIQSPLSTLHWQSFEALLTNETMFFRDQYPFEGLKNVIIPSLIKTQEANKVLTIWCAAASTGQEPYSIAILIKEYFPELIKWKINLIATDICTVALNKAKIGIYNEAELSRGLTEKQIQTYFSKVSPSEYQISGDIRSMVHFSELNLIKELPAMPSYDLILIRNVLIYFSNENKRKVLDSMYQKLYPHGYLMLGTSEFISFDSALKRHSSEKLSYYSRG
jgi:chemotaxis protein methyltransferase CheR